MRRRALTLVEVLFSLGLVAGAMILVVTTLAAGLSYGRLKQETNVATDLCRQVIERSQSRGSLPAGTQSYEGAAPTNGFPPLPYPETVIDGRTYRVQVWLKPVVGAVNVHNLVVRVSWNGRQVQMESNLYAI